MEIRESPPLPLENSRISSLGIEIDALGPLPSWEDCVKDMKNGKIVKIVTITTNMKLLKLFRFLKIVAITSNETDR